jgi:Amt family ammonium transporter
VLGTYSFVSRYDCVASGSGFLAGLVAVSGCVDELEPWFAMVIGIISSLTYIAGCKILDKLHIDDPVEAVPINMFCGIWGTIATGIFDNERGLISDSPDKGAFFGYQLVGMITIILWTGLLSSAYFLIMKSVGKFRIDRSIEVIGLDIAEMGGLSAELFDKIRKENAFSPQNSMSYRSHLMKSSFG